jgi:hypothetical protein
MDKNKSSNKQVKDKQREQNKQLSWLQSIVLYL